MALAAPSPADARTLLERLRVDPVLFAEHVLGLRLWRRQRDVAQALATSPRVAVRSGHKIGKSTMASALALWWVFTRPRARVLLTAPSDHQVKNILWREIRRMHAHSVIPLGGEPALDHRTGYKLSGGREIIGITTNETERIAGISSPDLLIIVDEAAGYPEPLYESLFGNLAGGGRILLLGNPTQTSGTFYAAFHGDRDRWHTIHVSSCDSPCVTGDEPCIPGLATREWIEWAEQHWGRESPVFAVRVLGEFPTQSESAVIPLGLVEAAAQRWHDVRNSRGGGAPLRIGVDVARFGDDRSVIQPVRGLYAYRPTVLHGADVVQVAGKTRELAMKLRRANERPRVSVDTIGVGGGVADILRQDQELEVAEINVSERATAEGYVNLRSQLWFALRDWLAAGGTLPPSPELEAELVAASYSFDARGRYRVDPKDKIKRILGRSPDMADALALAIYEPPVAQPRVEVL